MGVEGAVGSSSTGNSGASRTEYEYQTRSVNTSWICIHVTNGTFPG